MIDLTQEFGTDKTAEEEGKWFYPWEGKEAALKIARAGNKKWLARVQRLPRNIQRQISNRRMSVDKLTELWAEMTAECILLDWKGISFDGVEKSYGQEAGKTALLMRDFFDFVWSYAEDMEAFRQERREEDSKNL